MSKFSKRIKRDYFSKSRLNSYESYLKGLLDNGFSFICVKDAPNHINEKVVLLRHDIDTDLKIAKKMFNIEKKLNIKSTYYFRLKTANKPFIKVLNEYGNEVSYHFEEISTFAYKKALRNKDDVFDNIKTIRSIFENNLINFRKKYDCECETIASHGDFLNRKLNVVNNEFLNDKLREKLNIKIEAYDAILMDNFQYISDGNKEFANLIDDSIKNQKPSYMLVHPRTWESSFLRIFVDLKRAGQGISYKIRSKTKYAFKVLKEVRHMPKVTLHFVGKENYETYKYFTKRHKKIKIFRNKTLGVCLLKKPNSFQEYLQGKLMNQVRTSRNRCARNEYYFAPYDINKSLDDIYEINTSKANCQGQEMHDVYFDKSAIIKDTEGTITFGVFTKEGKLVSYCNLIDAGDFLIITRLLGHGDYLKEGVMYFMISEVVRLLIENKSFAKYEYLLYDMWLGAKKGLKTFKKELGFIPYRAKYKYREN